MADEQGHIDDDLSVVLTDIESGNVYVYSAVSDVNTQDGTEVTAEPGVAGRIGPDLPNRMTMKIECVTLDSPAPANRVAYHTEMISQTAKEQHQRLVSLKRKGIYVSSRSVPDPAKVWVIESVKANDSLQSTNSYQVDVSLIELIGGAAALANGGAVLSLGTIAISVPPGVAVDASGNPIPDDKTPTGAGRTACKPTAGDYILAAINPILETRLIAQNVVGAFDIAAKTPAGRGVASFFRWSGRHPIQTLALVAPAVALQVGGTIFVSKKVAKLIKNDAANPHGVIANLTPRCVF